MYVYFPAVYGNESIYVLYKYVYCENHVVCAVLILLHIIVMRAQNRPFT